VKTRLLRAAAPIAAFAFSLLVSSIALLLSGKSPLSTFSSMLEYGSRLESIVDMVNKATPLYLAGLAAAIGFKMNLFNIGVEGQYRLAALLATAAGAAVHLPAVLHVAFVLAVAITVGSAWSGVAGLMKVTRGVNEVIATIMLNAIAVSGLSYLLTTYLLDKSPEAQLDLDTRTKALPKSAWFPNLDRVVEGPIRELKSGMHLYSFVLVAVVVGVGYWFVLSRTRFGFDLRASGLNPLAAQAAGVRPKAMVMTAMLMSGGVAGLVGMAQVLSYSHVYGLDFVSGLGLTGIGVALLGRNNPAGVAVAALLFGFLERASQNLSLEGVPKSIVVIMQGSILLSVVVAYEVVDRLVRIREVNEATSAMSNTTDAGAATMEAVS
jgi:general nucleoside transport system permease protein